MDKVVQAMETEYSFGHLPVVTGYKWDYIYIL